MGGVGPRVVPSGDGPALRAVPLLIWVGISRRAATGRQ
jgi:hypothetical protein